MYVHFLGKACYMVSNGLMETKKLTFLFLKTKNQLVLVLLKPQNVHLAARQ